MEINRHFRITPPTAVDGPGSTREEAAHRKEKSVPLQEEATLPIGQMQQALRAMPDVDLEKVAEIKLALQRGEVSLDVEELARSVMAYHRGSDV
ncbi:flagellar biosynthesis anti-sigma factor FlgM [Alkalilimnicola ehrlichii]|uniref:Negative regulator of flagellin synthesis n=1 Tax=Alkalilimnicola ehrlichii TaxID=351052 RepID=A0A3E0WZF7_9GAMM|nr:flagellar biosynthesis anti-sigma factor FlgM [Alkalilimnicola ehrlichii]RFA30836.1 flagellar biosynthesis anti-sigma factor FlgM [Alkalilimnicola ehrlichii]RFA38416.1 flagellar biosynthesis anti-sigma factor FlgM [Alkalilimnicola ehrlichii]